MECGELIDKPVHEFAGGRGIRVGDNDIGKVRRVQMVVNQQFRAGEGEHLVAQCAYAFGLIEVGTYNKVCRIQQGIRLCGLLLVHHDLLRSRHPHQERGECVRHHHIGRFAQAAQVVHHTQAASHGISVGGHVGENDNVGGTLNEPLRGSYLLCGQFVGHSRIR